MHISNSIESFAHIPWQCQDSRPLDLSPRQPAYFDVSIRDVALRMLSSKYSDIGCLVLPVVCVVTAAPPCVVCTAHGSDCTPTEHHTATSNACSKRRAVQLSLSINVCLSVYLAVHCPLDECELADVGP